MEIEDEIDMDDPVAEEFGEMSGAQFLLRIYAVDMNDG